MAFQVSPGVAYSEVDLTTTIPTTSVSNAGFVGYFSQGPVDQVVTISSENELVEIFGKPNSDNSSDWLTLSSFLAYGGTVQVVRQVGATAVNAVEEGSTPELIKNKTYFENRNWNGITFAARTAGDWANDLYVVILGDGHDTAATAYDVPKITDNSDMHVFIVNGAVASGGVPISDNVVESFLWLSDDSTSKDGNGESNYYKNVINQKSKYVYAGGIDVDLTDADYTDGYHAIELNGGVNGSVQTKNYDIFLDTDQIEIDLVISGTDGGDAAVTLASTRRDCVAFVSPDLTDVNGTGDQDTKATAIIASQPSTLNSYGVMDSGWKKMYDKYNDTWVQVPLNGDIAGLCTATDESRGSWYSPAGFTRGKIRNCAGLLFDPNKASRDKLYLSNVNPVASFPGEGYVLFGDKTLQTKPSAFDRINVRRLFITLEKTISSSAKYSLFEFNDEFTRGQFKSSVEPYLRGIKAQRGIVDYLVVCDETNNPPSVVDNNEFVGDIFIKPARSINYIQLNFVAVSTGVNFQEVVGAV